MENTQPLTKRVSRPRYADVMSTLAVVLALTGTAYAAGLAPNSVKSKQIKNGAVRSVDVKDGDLLATDFKSGQLVAGPAGPVGPAGAPGAAGSPGQQGQAGPTFGRARNVGQPSLGTPEASGAQTDFTLPSAGPVFITAMSNEVDLNCMPDAATVAGLVIDGTVVPGTTRSSTSISPGVGLLFNVSGVSAPLSAGPHTASIAATCVGGATANGLSIFDPSITVILLGSS